MRIKETEKIPVLNSRDFHEKQRLSQTDYCEKCRWLTEHWLDLVFALVAKSWKNLLGIVRKVFKKSHFRESTLPFEKCQLRISSEWKTVENLWKNFSFLKQLYARVVIFAQGKCFKNSQKHQRVGGSLELPKWIKK